MMGQFEARFPTDRQYARNHMWGSQRDGLVRFGFTAYAVRLMLDVYFLEWHVEAGILLEHRQEIGAIESKKAESSLYAPIAGRLVRFNNADSRTPPASTWTTTATVGSSRSKAAATNCCPRPTILRT